MSSGSETRQRAKVLPPVRCTADELAAVEAAARAAGCTVSQLIRERVLDRPAPGPRPRRRTPTADVQHLARILGQLGKWGSNLNQLAHAANMDRPPTEADWERLAGQVCEIAGDVSAALGRGHQG